MKTSSRSLLFAAAAALGATALHAQLTLENFSAFPSANTLFYGEWANSGDPFSGDPAPVADFHQAVGSYEFLSATNADSAKAERTFTAARNLAGYDLLTVSLRVLGDNAAESFTVTLFDAGFNTASATFLTGGFTAGGFTSRSAALTAAGAFDFSAVSSFQISGNDPFGGAPFRLAFDDLSATRTAVTPPPANNPVPEPAAYGLLAAAALGLVVIARRRSAHVR